MEKELGQLFLVTPVPGELEAQRRAWHVVRAAFVEREAVRRPVTRLRPLIAFAVLAAVVGAAVSPVGGWLRDRVEGERPAEPALFRVPAAGRLLVVSERGPWVVQRDGSKRLLGRYEGADFSPSGLFLVVTRGRRVTAVEPDGDPRWSVTRPQMVAQARWAPGRFRVAYRAGDTLRIVDGNGTDDRLLARGVAPVAPAWRPQAEENVLAYTDAKGRVHVVDVDRRTELWRTDPARGVRRLIWSPTGRRLLVLASGSRQTLYGGNGKPAGALELSKGHTVVTAAFAPNGESVAYAEFDPASGTSALVERRGDTTKTLQRGAGRFEDVAWSPNGRWLLVTWPDADQFLFLRLPGVRKISAVSGIGREFDPGGEGAGPFPRVAGWCCAP